MDEAGGATWEMQSCIEKEGDFQDARLNAAYQKLKATLPHEKWIRLRDQQRAWLFNRDHDIECRWEAETEGQAQRIAANDCTLRKVAIRADELEGKLPH